MLRVMWRYLLLAIFILVFVVTGALLAISRHLDTPMQLDEEGFVFTVPSGSSLTFLSRSLAETGILTWPDLLVAWSRITGQSKIKAGEYRLKSGDTPKDLLEMLTEGSVLQYQITFPEGLRFAEWLDLLNQQPKLKKLLTGLSEEKIIDNLSLEIEHLEGWFFPDTYLYSYGDSDRDILSQAHQRMNLVLAEEWQQRIPDLPYRSSYEALILASIVEKETGIISERGEIAGVFVRRLKRGMKLQTDPTIIYGLGDDYQGYIKRRHLQQATPYNTYLIEGLPPTPIAMPGRGAIHAVLNPAEGDGLFFVAKGDGSHYFSATYEEHLKAVRQFQLQRRSDYRSTPR
ncbi:endolytic transglycosylase MltG [Porticoccus sp.]|uniref:endolytic transglycosylase MltG n=1 Tax=Porticoccus sp. TaxID=2024853 RepID=UPI003F69D47D